MSTATSLPYGLNDTAVRTTLSNDITSGATSFDVSEVTNAPSVPFLIAVWVDQSPLREDDMEIMEVTGISGTTLTVTRGAKGTAAQSFSSGDKVFMGVAPSDVFDEVSGVPQGVKNTIESNTQTSLENLLRSKANAVEHNNTALGTDDAIYDIFADESKVFSSSKVLIRDVENINDEDGTVKIGNVVDDFEGNLNGWSGDTGVISLTTSPSPPQGSQILQFDQSGTSATVTSLSFFSSGTKVLFYWRQDYAFADTGDQSEITFLNGNDNEIGRIRFTGTSGPGVIEWYDGSYSSIGSFDFATWNEYGFVFNFANNQVDIYKDGTLLNADNGYVNTSSEVSDIEVSQTVTEFNRKFYMDYITQTGLSSGTVKSEAKNLYDAAGFVYVPDEAYVTLDADIPTDEDVTVTLADGYGNSVQATVGEFTDISTLNSGIVRVDPLELTSSDGDDTPTVRSYAVHVREGTGDWDDVLADYFPDESKITSKTDVSVTTEGNGTSGKVVITNGGSDTPGTFDAPQQSLGYTPSAVQIEAARTIPTDEDIEVDLTDENANTDTITTFGSKVSLSSITGAKITPTWRLKSSDGNDTPTLEEYDIRFYK
jgi:hypothetical protein